MKSATRGVYGPILIAIAAFACTTRSPDGASHDTDGASEDAAAPTTGAATPEEGPRGEPAAAPEESQLTPRERDRRGDEHLFAGRFDEAIADFDAFLEAEPHWDAHHWRRGIAYYYAGRYADGAAQFERHRKVNPDDVENAAWHFLCVARLRGVEEARAELLPVGPDQRDPMKRVYALFAGEATPQDVLDDAARSSQRDAPFFAHLYLALYADVTGDREAARLHVREATTTHARTHYMGDVARVHATLLLE